MAPVPQAGGNRKRASDVKFTPVSTNSQEIYGVLTASGWRLVTVESRDRASDGFTNALEKKVQEMNDRAAASSGNSFVVPYLINRVCSRKNLLSNKVLRSPKKWYKGEEKGPFPRKYFLLERVEAFQNSGEENKRSVKEACEFVFQVSKHCTVQCGISCLPMAYRLHGSSGAHEGQQVCR